MARLRRTPGLRLVLLLALLPLAALPWLGQRFVETVDQSTGGGTQHGA